MTSIEIQNETKRKMEKSLELLKEELKSIRTGRATPGLVENVRVSCYGSLTPIKQLANITAPEPQLITISPYDPSIVKDIDKAISQSDLGLTTNTDGKIIRVLIPPLSGDRRGKIVAQIKEMTEASKISIRNIRRDANKHIDKEEKDSVLTEDEAKKAKDQIQKSVHENEAKINEFLKQKTDEILTV
mgnify:FL=1